MTGDFAKAWERYKKTDKFSNLQLNLRQKGIEIPYCDNILWWAFSAGWTSGNEQKEEDNRLHLLQMKSKIRHR